MEISGKGKLLCSQYIECYVYRLRLVTARTLRSYVIEFTCQNRHLFFDSLQRQLKKILIIFKCPIFDQTPN